MKRFKKILVGVDLSQGDRYVSDRLPEPTAEAVDRALWLAKTNSASVTYCYALHISARAQHMIEEDPGDHRDVIHEAQHVLRSLAAQAADAGVTAETIVPCGKPSAEMIRLVVHQGHDLMIVGTRHHTALELALFGRTGNNLLRGCPCPVWVTKPQRDPRIQAILVAHCLREVGDLAMELGASMSELHGAQLHVLHSTETPEANNNRAEAERRIRAQLQSYDLDKAPQIHIVHESPEEAIVKAIDQYGVELLAMGTVARTGIAGMVVGNTAEELLPQIRCSLLAVKPPGFQTHVAD